MNTLNKKLNTMLADGMVFYQKLRHYHWEIQGRQFFQLHDKFEQMYENQAKTNDVIAERIMTLGDRPLGTMSDAVDMATLKEDSTTPSADKMVAALLEDMNNIVSSFNEGIKTAEEANDFGTADMLTAFLQTVQKDGWMLRSFLNEQAAMADSVSHEKVAEQATV